MYFGEFGTRNAGFCCGDYYILALLHVFLCLYHSRFFGVRFTGFVTVVSRGLTPGVSLAVTPPLLDVPFYLSVGSIGCWGILFHDFFKDCGSL